VDDRQFEKKSTKLVSIPTQRDALILGPIGLKITCRLNPFASGPNYQAVPGPKKARRFSQGELHEKNRLNYRHVFGSPAV